MSVSKMEENKSSDRRTLKTKKAIFQAFSELLKEKELRKITVQEIVDKADISRVTFYKYYLDVYDLYDKIESELLTNIGLITLQLADKTFNEFFKELINYVYNNRVTFEMVFSPNVTNKLRDKVSCIIEGILKKIYSEKLGISIDNEDLAYLCCYRSSGFLAVIQRWVQNGFSQSCENMVKQVSVFDDNIEQIFSNKRKQSK